MQSEYDFASILVADVMGLDAYVRDMSPDSPRRYALVEQVRMIRASARNILFQCDLTHEQRLELIGKLERTAL